MKKSTMLALVIVFAGVTIAYATNQPTIVYGNLIGRQQQTTENQNNGYIGHEQAQKIVLDDLKVAEGEVSFIKNKLDYEDGIVAYEVSFIYNSEEYDYSINASNGTIFKFKKEAIPKPGIKQIQDSASITLDQALAIALEHNGTTADQVDLIKQKTDLDDGVIIYEIDFISDGKKYEFEILNDGSIDQYSYEIISDTIDVLQNTDSSSNGISIEKAKEIALANAGLASQQVIFTKTKTDYEHGKTVYEIEFIYQNKEYEYTIDLATGTILEADRD